MRKAGEGDAYARPTVAIAAEVRLDMDLQREAVVWFWSGPVFDASDLNEIDAKPLPQAFAPLPDDCGPLYDAVKQNVEASGIAVEERPLPPGVQGVSWGGTVSIKPGLDSRNRLFVLLHELCHELAHRGDQQRAKSAQQREVEAESVAFVVASVLGLEIPSLSDYLLNWHGSADQLKASFGVIQSLVRRVLAIARPDRRADDRTHDAEVPSAA